MTFITPSDLPSIPTYRIMDSDGVLLDKNRGPPDVPKEEIVAWYKNMLTGQYMPVFVDHCTNVHSEHHGCDYV
jgi:2-oxoisovalerate dehydrogenase E1 component alpha subunit